jgi:hypothetical protein
MMAALTAPQALGLLSHDLVILGLHRQAKLQLSHHLNKNTVCAMFPRKNIMQPAETR